MKFLSKKGSFLLDLEGKEIEGDVFLYLYRRGKMQKIPVKVQDGKLEFENEVFDEKEVLTLKSLLDSKIGRVEILKKIRLLIEFCSYFNLEYKYINTLAVFFFKDYLLVLSKDAMVGLRKIKIGGIFKTSNLKNERLFSYLSLSCVYSVLSKKNLSIRFVIRKSMVIDKRVTDFFKMALKVANTNISMKVVDYFIALDKFLKEEIILD